MPYMDLDVWDLFTLSQWLLRLVMIPLVAYRRRLTSALSWLALVFLLPWAGSLLYLFMAEHRLTRRVRRHRRAIQRTRTEQRLAFQDAFATEAPLHRRNRELGILTQQLGGFSVLGGNHVQAMAGDEGAVDALVRDIEEAGREVHLLFYTIACDATGTGVAEALERAAARGVKCRVLADAMGSRAFHRKLAPRLRRAGVDVRKMLPFDRLLRRLRPLDLRNHRKLAVVDGRVAYTGSMNLLDHDEASGTEHAPWRGVLVRLRGPAVLQLQLVFLEDWAYNTDEDLSDDAILEPPGLAGDVPLQVVPSGPTEHVETVHSLLVSAINGARERVVITTPYFIPDEPTRMALRLATLRGVEVDVVLPGVSDSRFVTAAGQSYYREFLDEGVRILEHRDGFLHAKTITVDDAFAVVGSVNFDRRSFYLNFELALLLYGPEPVLQIGALQDGYMAAAVPLDGDAWERRPLWRKVGEDVARLMSPLL